MARFAKSRVCPATKVDETIRDIVSLHTRDDITASNEGQTVLITVTITALPMRTKDYGEDHVLVTCVLGNARHDL